jgi:AcrR family transcriptional regulator
MRRSKTLPKGHRDRLLPRVAHAFVELGYRGATTAELARQCGVRENVLYRVWPNKKEMFISAIEYVSALSLETWERLLANPDKRSPAERLLEYEAVHQGEFGLYRIVFSGLSETDDLDIREALRSMYLRFHRFVSAQLAASEPGSAEHLLAWAFVGLATVSNISRELGLMTEPQRQGLFRDVGRRLLVKR